MTRRPDICLLEGLIPPDGFQLDCLVATTYSLNPTVLLSLLVTVCSQNTRGGIEDIGGVSKEEILNALQISKEKCLVFCDHHGKFEGKQFFSPLEAIALGSVKKSFGRSTDKIGSLHSKLIVAAFMNGKDHILRVYAGSKNFTESSYDELGAVFDFRETKSVPDKYFVNPLKEYLEYLKRYEARGITNAQKLKPLNRLLSILGKKEFRCTSNITPEFLWQGRDLSKDKNVTLFEKLKKTINGIPDRVSIHSPWARETITEKLIELSGKKTKIFIKCLKEPGLSTVLSPNVKYELVYSKNDQLPESLSHAKIYLFKFSNEGLLVFGSANLTNDAWGLNALRNSEILIAMRGPYRDFVDLELKHWEDLKSKVDPKKRKDSSEDKIQNYLNSVSVQLQYDTNTGDLIYSLDSSTRDELPEFKIRLEQDLIEESSDGERRLEVWSGNKLPKQISYKFPFPSLYLISPCLRIQAPEVLLSGQPIESHLVLDLDIIFFTGREKLKCLTYTSQEAISSLAKLMEISLPDPTTKGPGDKKREGKEIAFVSQLRLERYLYRMARKKHLELEEYKLILERIKRLLVVLEKKGLDKDTRLSKALVSIQEGHKVLDGA